MRSNVFTHGHPFRLIILLCLFTSPIYVSGQLSGATYISKGAISQAPGISLLVQNLQYPCGNTVGLGKKKTFFRLKLSGIKNKYSGNKSKYNLLLRLKVEDCKGKVFVKNFRIDLSQYNRDGEIRNDGEWYFEGSKLIAFDGTIQEIKIAPECESRLPGEIMVSKEVINPGESVILSIDSDGTLCQNAIWEWTEGDCEYNNQIQANKNTSIIVAPLKTTTYNVRIRESNQLSSCISKTIYVTEPQIIQEEKPRPTRRPIIVTGAPKEELCPNTTIRMSASGGLDTDANNWVWKKNSCNGEIIGMGNSLDYKTDQHISLFVQDVNDNDSECKEIVIQVKKMPVPVDLMINNGAGSLSICEGESATLQLSNVSDAASYQLSWSDEQNRILLKNSSSLTVKPSKTSKFYLQGEGVCNARAKAGSFEVKIIEKSIKPESITTEKQRGKMYKFSIKGGVLETGAAWKWYKGNTCATGEPLAEGNEITIKAKKLNALSVRAEGGKCGSSECYTQTVINKKKKRRFGFINVGTLDQELNNLSFTIGSKRLYLRYKTGIKNISAPYEITYSPTLGNTISNYPIQTSTYYEFSGEKTILRNAYTGGFMIGGRVLRIYLGGGLGEATSAWGVNIADYNNPAAITKTWGAVQKETYRGIEGEAGLFIRLGFLNIMGGVNLIYDNKNGQYIDGTLGLGLTF